MNLLKSIQDAAARGLQAARGDVPSRRTVPPVAVAAQASTISAPARLRSRLTPTTLDYNDFVASQAWRASEWFTIAQFKTPEDTVFKLEAGRTFRAYLYARVKKLAGFAAGSQVINCPGLIDTPQTSNALPSKYHPEVRVHARTAGGWAEVNVEAINFATGAVTYTEPAACLEVEAYYLQGDGEMSLEISRNLGNSDYMGREFYNQSLGTLHQTDQISSKTAHKLGESRILVPGYTFKLNVKSSVEIPFSARAPHVLQIPSMSGSLEVFDKSRLGQLTEVDLREGV